VPPTIEAKRRTAREPAIVTSARVESEREVLVALITSATMVLFTESAASAGALTLLAIVVLAVGALFFV
jgi:hypothetical protein